MRQAMAEAEVGDEQRFEDPTVTALCERVAELLGHRGRGLPARPGTMCNEIAFRLHIRPGGDEAILHRTLAPDHRRGRRPGGVLGRGAAARSTAPRGMFTPRRRARRAAPPGDRYSPRSRLVSVEQTTNMAGGRVWPLDAAARGRRRSRSEHGLRLHLDGARLMNAVVASGVPAAELTRRVRHRLDRLHQGARRAGGRRARRARRELIDEAWRYKQMLGGALRQAGIVAAGALYALDHHVERLAEDHANARALADGLAAIAGRRRSTPARSRRTSSSSSTTSPSGCVRSSSATGVIMGAVGAAPVRAVTHLDVDAGRDTDVRWKR